MNVDLLNSNLTTNINIPKLSTLTFEFKNNYYVVTDGSKFLYYSIKVSPSEDISPLIRLEKSPPVIVEGMAIIKKKLYLVTVNDLFRRVIRKSREIKLKEIDGRTFNSNEYSSTSIPSSIFESGVSPSSTQTLQHSDELVIKQNSELEIDQAANIAWQEQITTLLHTLHTEEGEEWEITDIA